jgi:phosphatidate cytidylyltransferase
VAESTADNLWRRILSALVLIPIAIGAAALGGWTFVVLVALAAVLMAYEWDHMSGGEGLGAIGLLSAAVAVVALVLAGLALYLPALVAMVVGAAVAALLAALRRRPPTWPALGVLYVCLPCIILVWLRAAPEGGRETVFWIFLLVWATDIGAYFAGRGIGGPRMAPRISPGKTWAGLAGGMVCAALAGAGFGLLSGASRLGALAAMSAVLAGVSQAGDLAESAVKRRFGVKDSGKIIPGHGGVLDRLDGLLFATTGVGALALFGGGELAWR